MNDVEPKNNLKTLTGGIMDTKNNNSIVQEITQAYEFTDETRSTKLTDE